MLNRNKLRSLKSLHKLLVIASFPAFLYSCGCSYHLRKIKGKCGIETETIKVTDTIRVPEVRTDSMFFYNQKDTVIIQRDNLEIKYFYSNDSVFIDGTCKEKVILKERVITVNKFKPTDSYWYLYVIGFLLTIILLKRFKVL